MHQGQLASLADVVRFYSTLEGAAPVGHHQERLLKPLELSAQEQLELVAFLESLSGADSGAGALRAAAGAQPERAPAR
jgi:cytochrome c peroxidase